MKVRFITPYYGVKGVRILTLPALAAEFSPWCDVEVCDQNVEEIDYSDCDMVGISLVVYNAPIGYEIAKKFMDRGIPVIMGGTWPSVSPDMVQPYCDSVVVGEVEGLGKKIIDDLKNGKLKKRYRNKVPPALETLRLPRFDVLKNDRYYIASGFPMEITRGCPNSCSFCVSGRIQPTYRKKPYWKVMQELEARDNAMVRVIDLNAAVDKEYFMDICRIFADSRVRHWSIETCIDYLDDEKLLGLLEKSNCIRIYVGIESISEKSLATINKGFNTVGKYREIIKKCHDHGLKVSSGFVVGLDGEDKSIFEKSLEFFNDVRIDFTTPTFVTYLPGPPAHAKMKKEGRIITDDLADYDGVHPVVEPDMMTVDELLEGVEWFIDNFFSMKSIALRALQKPNLKPANLVAYLGINHLFSNMYKALYTPDENGRVPIRDRELFDSLSHKPLDKKEYGFNPVLDAVISEVVRTDAMRRPLAYLRQRLRQSPELLARNIRSRAS